MSRLTSWLISAYLALNLGLLYIITLICSPLSRRSRLARHYVSSWLKHAIAGVSGLLALSRWTRVIISVDKESGKSLKSLFTGSTVWIANHQADIDWIHYLWSFASSQDLLGGFHVVVGSHFRKYPVLGPLMDACGYTFVGKDSPLTSQRYLKLLHIRRETKSPLSLLIFPEGAFVEAKTRVTSQAFATKTGIRDFQNLLFPRTTGTYTTLADLQKTYGSDITIIDMTLGYPDVPPDSFPCLHHSYKLTYFQRIAPAEMSLHLEAYTLQDALGQTEEEDQRQHFDEWLLSRWRAKDQHLSNFRRTGHFADSQKTVSWLVRPSLRDLVALGGVWLVIYLAIRKV